MAWVSEHVQTAAGSCGIHGSHALRMGSSPTWGRGRGRVRGRVRASRRPGLGLGFRLGRLADLATLLRVSRVRVRARA